jgi:hypothetical protein
MKYFGLLGLLAAAVLVTIITKPSNFNPYDSEDFVGDLDN